MIQRLGRALGPGSLKREQRGRGPAQYIFRYTDSRGSRRRIALSTHRRVAEMKSRELLHERDMELLRLGAVAGQSKPLREIIETYLDDLATRASAAHVRNTGDGLEHVLAATGIRTPVECQPVTLIRYRAARLAEGVSVRTANLHCDTLRSWGDGGRTRDIQLGKPKPS